MLDAIVPPGRQPVARIGETIDLHGHHLDGTGRAVLLSTTASRSSRRSPRPAAERRDASCSSRSRWRRPGDFPVGVYRVCAGLVRAGRDRAARDEPAGAGARARRSRDLPMTVVRDGAGDRDASRSTSRPALRAGQTRVAGARRHAGVPPQPFARPTDHARRSSSRTRRPGIAPRRACASTAIDSPIIDRRPTPPVFLDQRIDITMSVAERTRRLESRPTSACWSARVGAAQAPAQRPRRATRRTDASRRARDVAAHAGAGRDRPARRSSSACRAFERDVLLLVRRRRDGRRSSPRCAPRRGRRRSAYATFGLALAALARSALERADAGAPAAPLAPGRGRAGDAALATARLAHRRARAALPRRRQLPRRAPATAVRGVP